MLLAMLSPKRATTYVPNESMKKVAAREFQARCLTLMEEVRSTRQPLLITKRGKPVANLVPADIPRRGFIGRLKASFRLWAISHPQLNRRGVGGSAVIELYTHVVRSSMISEHPSH